MATVEKAMLCAGSIELPAGHGFSLLDLTIVRRTEI
jgi:hypothetical protein